jgi:ribosome-associated toxin RatA of RatAB toxin-antitoxin module
MPSVSKSVLVEHSAQRMFDLVDRVEDYPEFLPWCGGTTILERTPEALVSRIEINFHGVRTHFTTANRNEPPARITIALRDGHLRYEFAAKVLEGLIEPVFNHIAATFIDAFVKRADDLDKRTT